MERKTTKQPKVEYLTTNELSQRIKMSPGSIRNLISHNEFKLNVHYVKPTSRKILFIWSAIEKWLWGGNQPGAIGRGNGLINI